MARERAEQGGFKAAGKLNLSEIVKSVGLIHIYKAH